MSLAQGGVLSPGGVSGPGVGMYAPRVSALGGCLLWGVSAPGGVSALGGCLLRGGLVPEGVWGGVVSQHALRQTPPL